MVWAGLRSSLCAYCARDGRSASYICCLWSNCTGQGDSSIRSSLRIPEIGPHFSRINTELSHAVAQCASFHTQSGCCSLGTTHPPFGLLENVHNFLLLFEITDNLRRVNSAVWLVG